MTDKEIELSIRIIEEHTNSKIDRLDSKIDRFQSDLENYKESHSSEHEHNENELNLKLDLINERISVLQEKYTIFIQQENNHEIKSLSLKQLKIGWWTIVVTVVVFFVSNFLGINYESVKKYFDSTKVEREK